MSSEIDSRLVEMAVDALNGLQSQADTEGWELTPKLAAEAILRCFQIRDEFRSIYHDDVGGPQPDLDPLCGQVFTSAQKLAEAMKASPMPWREMQHRWVAETDWQRVEARVDWTYQ